MMLTLILGKYSKLNLFLIHDLNTIYILFRVKSCIDGRSLDGIYSIRVHNGVDYSGKSRFIRWTEVFVIQVSYFYYEPMICDIFSYIFILYNKINVFNYIINYF